MYFEMTQENGIIFLKNEKKKICLTKFFIWKR